MTNEQLKDLVVTVSMNHGFGKEYYSYQIPSNFTPEFDSKMVGDFLNSEQVLKGINEFNIQNWESIFSSVINHISSLCSTGGDFGIKKIEKTFSEFPSLIVSISYEVRS